MYRFFFTMVSLIIVFSVCAQTGKTNRPQLLKYIGTYETNGFEIQVALHQGGLVLVVPGAPLQELIWLHDNKFRSDSFEDALFVFLEQNGIVNGLVSESAGNSTELRKISNVAYKIDATDSLLTLSKSTKNFIFLYGPVDSLTIPILAGRLENDYHKILSDFGLKSLPKTTVRVYPDLESFHRGINFPYAPDQLLATAFGKDDFRMTSPSSVEPADSLLLVKMVTHEFTHCVHLNIDYSPNNPRWLWEGVANFEAGWFVNPGEVDVVKDKAIPPLAMLNNGLEYELGYVIIEAIKEIWSFEKVVELIKKRGEIQAVLHVSPEEFENKIYKHIYAKYLK